jgi:hypothetical protein
MLVESYRPQVGTVLEQLAEGLAPFVDKHMSAYFDGDDWIVTAATRMGKREPALATAADPQFQLEVMIRWWGPVFSKLLAVDDREAITELRSIRNQWAHIVDDQPLDLTRALHACQLAEDLLRDIGSPAANNVSRLGRTLRLDSAKAVAAREGTTESDILVKQLDELQRQRAELHDQLDEARRQAATATGRGRAVARQLADLQTQYAAVAGLRDRYFELQQQLEVARRGESEGGADTEKLLSQLQEAQAAMASLQDDSTRLSDELRLARSALADPAQTEVGRRWLLLVAVLVMVLGVVIIFAYALGTTRA